MTALKFCLLILDMGFLSLLRQIHIIRRNMYFNIKYM